MARRFNSLADCRRYLASVINRVDAGALDPQVGGRLGYLTNILASTIRDTDLEERIQRLESQQKQIVGGNKNVVEIKSGKVGG